MRQSFRGYYSPSDAEIETLWSSALIVPDANVLLHVYRYSPQTRSDLLGVLQRLKERLWIPHQFALEFHKRRLDVIAAQAKSCEEVAKKLEELLTGFKSPKSHVPIDTRALKSMERVRQSLLRQVETYAQLLSNDDQMVTVSGLFDGRVGSPPREGRLLTLHQEGAARYKDKIPPGYSDDSKPGLEKFGDYIGWAQILEHAKATHKDVLLVTDDRKSDWWIERVRGRFVGPRPELMEEFRKVTNQAFYMYQPEQFMEEAGRRFNVTIAASTLTEVRNVLIFDLEKISSPSSSSVHAPKVPRIAIDESTNAGAVSDKESSSASALPEKSGPAPEQGEL